MTRNSQPNRFERKLVDIPGWSHPAAFPDIARGIEITNATSMIFLGGIAPIDENGQVVNGGIEPQADLVLHKMRELLHGSGWDWQDIVSIRWWVLDMSHLPLLESKRRQVMGEVKAAVMGAEVSSLGLPDILLEVEVIGAR